MRGFIHRLKEGLVRKRCPQCERERLKLLWNNQTRDGVPSLVCLSCSWEKRVLFWKRYMRYEETEDYWANRRI
jgi:Zn ribbon nucleic-acid-binding protein